MRSLVDGNVVGAGHAVRLEPDEEPAGEFYVARCTCAWNGPHRPWVEEAAMDAATHLLRPGDIEFEGRAYGQPAAHDMLRAAFAPARRERIQQLARRQATGGKDA